ncbi:hypothetical protein TWF730_001816 [Orbilia blumenaviensis]|uniref:DRBM domain-containing protein n=1 Tax=Orbilia blumenaviensis TaxID=1796055 RepID=A0AAV9UCT7_9PEZI
MSHTQQAPSAQGLTLTSQEREVFERFLAAEPGERMHMRREELRVAGQFAIADYIWHTVSTTHNTPETSARKVEIFGTFLCQQTSLQRCYEELDQERVFGRRLDLTREGEDLNGADVLCILFAMHGEDIAPQIKSHVANWIAGMIVDLRVVIEQFPIDDPAAYDFDSDPEEGLDGGGGDENPATAYRRGLDEYAEEQGGLTVHYGNPRQRDGSRHWICKLTVARGGIGALSITGTSGTKEGSKETAARRMLQMLRGI